MKLEKREITLNETDSLKDMYILEKALCREYGQGEKFAERKETEREFARLQKEAEEDMSLMQERMEKSEKSGGVFSRN